MTFGKVVLIEVITNFGKSDKPFEREVVVFCILIVIITSIKFVFSTFLKQVGNFTRLDRKCSSKNQSELHQSLLC